MRAQRPGTVISCYHEQSPGVIISVKVPLTACTSWYHCHSTHSCVCSEKSSSTRTSAPKTREVGAGGEAGLHSNSTFNNIGFLGAHTWLLSVGINKYCSLRAVMSFMPLCLRLMGRDRGGSTGDETRPNLTHDYITQPKRLTLTLTQIQRAIIAPTCSTCQLRRCVYIHTILNKALNWNPCQYNSNN